MTTWPADDPAALEAFYSPFMLKADGTPTARWEERNLVGIKPPYPSQRPRGGREPHWR